MADKNEENIVELRKKLDRATTRLDRIQQLLSEKVKHIFIYVKKMTFCDILVFK